MSQRYFRWYRSQTCFRWDRCLKDILDEIDVSCILYLRFEVLLIKDISTTKNESRKKNKHVSNKIDAKHVLDEIDSKNISCILYRNDLLFQYCRSKLLLIKDISTIKNES